MNFSRQNADNYLLYDTDIENLFISEYMAEADGNYVKQYLLALMHAEMNLPLDDAAIARQLGITKEDVLKGWDYWESKDLIFRSYPDPDDKSRCEIEFVNLKEELFGRRSNHRSKRKNTLEDKALAKLYRDIEASCGRTLGEREPEEIAVLISEYGMTPQVILFGYKYCADRRKSTSARFVASILKDWTQKGFTTVSAIEEYLSGQDRHYDLYHKVFKELGFHRNPTEPEKRIMDTWFDKMNFGVNDVLEACKKTTGISNPNINYLNSVLVNRYEELHPAEKQPELSQKDLFAGVNALYEKDRLENERLTKERRAEVFARIPQMEDLMAQIRELGYKLSKALLSSGSGSESVKKLRQQAAALNEKKIQLLASCGYAEDAMEPIYSCRKCKDTGLLDDGQRCPCFAEKAEKISKNR